METDKNEEFTLTIDEALIIIKGAAPNKFEISKGHEKTEAFIREHGLITDDVIDIIKSLEREDRIKGPVPDNKPGARRKKPVWIFKKSWNGELLYIKLKIFITNKKTYVVSIHIDNN